MVYNINIAFEGYKKHTHNLHDTY